MEINSTGRCGLWLLNRIVDEVVVVVEKILHPRSHAENGMYDHGLRE
jgi:hypothetical protein